MVSRTEVSAAELLARAKGAWAFTGAGVSTASGIPDFRGPDGLWRTNDPGRVSSIEGFIQDPQGFYDFWLPRFAQMLAAQPNPVHGFLAWLEDQGLLRGVITQNIDGLHQRAGSHLVLEVHGHFRTGSCLACGQSYPFPWITAEARRRGLARCRCGGLIKPDVVLFGEPLAPDFARAWEAVEGADLLVLGSSLTVWPAAGLVPKARANGGRLIIANGEPTPFDDLATVLLRGDLVQSAQALRRALEAERAGARAR